MTSRCGRYLLGSLVLIALATTALPVAAVPPHGSHITSWDRAPTGPGPGVAALLTPSWSPIPGEVWQLGVWAVLWLQQSSTTPVDADEGYAVDPNGHHEADAGDGVQHALE